MEEFLSRNAIPYERRDATAPDNRGYVQEHGAVPLLCIGDSVIPGRAIADVKAALASAGLLAEEREAPSSRPTPSESTSPTELGAGDVLLVASFLEDALCFHDVTSGRLLGDPPARLPVGSQPMSLALDPTSGVVCVAGYGSGSATFVDAARLSYLHGSLSSSMQPAGTQPSDVIYDSKRRRFLLSPWGEDSLVAFDSRTGRPTGGTLERSRIHVGASPVALALDPALDRLFVRTAAGIVALAAESGAPLFGDLEHSTIPAGEGRSLALDTEAHVLYTPDRGDRVARIDTAYQGDPNKAVLSGFAADPVPFMLLRASTQRLLMVSCLGSRRIVIFDEKSDSYLNGTLEASVLEVGAGARGLALDPSEEVLYVSCFEDDRLLRFDLSAVRSSRHAGAADEVTAAEAGRGPRGCIFLPRA